MNNYWSLIVFIAFLLSFSCGKGKHEIVGPPEIAPHSLTSIMITNNQMLLTGIDLDNISNVQITGPSGFNEVFDIESKSGSLVVANGQRDISFVIGSILNLIVTDAYGASSYSITFTLADGSVTGDKLNDMSAGTGQVLRYTGSTWAPSDLSGLTYAGNWNATTNSPDLDDSNNQGNGRYYIVNVAGTYDLDDSDVANWAVGDWVVWNGIDEKWDKVDNATYMQSFNGRSGAVTPALGDYSWQLIDLSNSTLGGIANVNISATPANGEVLVWNTNQWEPSTLVSATNNSDLTPSSITTTSQGGLVLDNSGAQTGEMRFKELDGNGDNYVALKSPASLGGDLTFTLPDSYGTNGQFLSTNGSGVLSWANASGGGGVGDFKADGSVAMTSDLNLGGNNIINGTWQGSTLGAAYLPTGGNWNLSSNLNIDSNVLYIENGGNIGVGTSTPGNKLEVNGNIGISAANELRFNDSDSSNYVSLKAPSAVTSNIVWTLPSTIGGAGEFLMNDGSGNLSWGAASSGGDIVAFTVVKTADQDVTASGTIITWDLEVTDSSNSFDLANNRFVAPSNGYYFLYGDFQGMQNETDDVDLRIYKNGVNTNIASYDGWPTGGSAYYRKSVMGAVIYLVQGDYVDIRSIGGEPVYGNASHYHTKFSGFKILGGGSGSDHSLDAADGSPANAIYVNNDGNVGIGTTTPGAKLHVKDGSAGTVTYDGNSRLQLESDGHTYIQFSSPNTYDQGIHFADPEGPTVGRISYSHSSDAMHFSTNSAIRMSVLSNGNVGIGTTSPSHLLHVTGVARSTQANWATSSDIRVKKNISPLKNGLDKIMALKPVTYQYTDEYIDGNEAMEGTHTGFIAQEVKEVDPTMVNYVEERVGTDLILDFHILSTSNMIPLLVKTTQEQQKEIERISEENRKMKEILCEIRPSANICQ